MSRDSHPQRRPRRRPLAPRLREIHSAAAVRARLDALAMEVARDYAGRLPLFVVIAEGARRFADELKRGVAARGLAVDSLLVRARRTEGTELIEVTVDDFDAKRCTGREVLVLDDIADEGRTLAAVLARVHAVRPSSVKVGVLVSKQARRAVPLTLDYVGFDVADGWVLGFGMDYEGRYRELDHLAVLEKR